MKHEKQMEPMNTPESRAGKVLNAFLSLLPANLVMLAVMTGFRAAILLLLGSFHHVSAHPAYYAQSFWFGVRYDASVIAYLNLPVALYLFIFPGNIPRFARFTKIYYSFMFSILVFISLADFGFYTYFKDHINVTIFDFFKTDTGAVLGAIVLDKRFLPAIAILIALIYGMVRMAKMTQYLLVSKKHLKKDPGRWWWTAAVYCVLLCFMVIMARGSMGGEVLKTSHSDFSPYDSINRLSLNGVKTFTFALDQEIKRARSDHDLMKVFGYEDIDTVLADLGYEQNDVTEVISVLEKRTPRDSDLEKKQPNVVFIIMESFGCNLMRYHSPSFNVLSGMEKHFDQDFLFKNIVPPGWLTTHGIEAYFLGVPRRPLSGDMMDTAQCRVPYKTSPAYAFKNAGYATEMIYGASLRLRDMEHSCAAQGFDARFGKLEMPVHYLKNTWGVHDRYLFEFLYERLQAGGGKKPKFIMALTCSNHPAFMPLPGDYKPLPLEVPAGLQPSLISDSSYVRQRLSYYQYANYWLNDFMTKLKQSPYAENTVVVVTGDHTFSDIFKDNDAALDKYTVPLYVYLPEKLKKKYHPDTGVIGSSADVLSTLYTVSLSGKEYYSFGEDLMGKSIDDKIVGNAQGVIVKKNALAKYNSANNRCEYYSSDGKGRYNRENTPDEAMIDYYKAYFSLVDYFVKTKGTCREE